MTDTEARIELAEAFLQEAVYRSRERQASSLPLASGDAGTCGLGERAAVELDVSDRGRELFETLWPVGLEPGSLERLRAAMAEWIRRQDALDRKRNHFMKDFRHEHGFDRGQYGEAEAAAWRAGLDGVNTEVDEGRRAAALAILALS